FPRKTLFRSRLWTAHLRIAAITVTVIAVVLLVFGVAAYLKIRHSSYGRLLDDHDYGSWGNYNNPLYDDS
uniref:Prostate androgen-regulated mucin-like protein 1 n=1 Tax=Panthera tigris altaica TaxID=74533 RepID=A0A8C9M4D3_PANTA